MRARLSGIALVVLVVALAGCGASISPAAGAADTPSPSAPSATVVPMNAPMSTVVPTTVVPTTVVPTITPGVAFIACDALANADATRVSDLLIGAASFAGLSYPSFQVPDNTPLKPLQVPINSQSPFGRPADTNPNMSSPHAGGYSIYVCNGSKTQSHTIGSVSARLDAFTPYGGNLNSWGSCAGEYNNQTGQTDGLGCGGAYFADYYTLATFAPNAAVGTSVTTSVGASNSSNQPPYQHTPLPAVLMPNHAIFIEVAVVPPTASGTYAFAIGLSVDGAAPVFASKGPPTLLAPVAHTWTGRACETPTMKAQIPASPLAYYICPAS